MAVAELRAQISSLFADAQNDENIMSECMALCQNFNLSPEELLYKWEAMTFSNSKLHLGSATPTAFTSESASALKQGLQREITAKVNKEQQERAKLNAVMMRPKREGSLRFQRPQGAVAFGTAKVTFKGPSDVPNDREKRRYRYMYEKISERSEVLDEKIDEMGELVKERYSIDELGDPSSASEDDVIVVGRICNDADSSSSSSSKLIDTYIFLESSRMMGSGARISLRFDPQLKLRGTTKGAGGLGLFPGSIVALKGKNGGGGWFAVKEILGIPPMTVSPSSLGSQNGVKPDPGNEEFVMCIASGPFTPDADLEYKIFNSLIEEIKSLRPAVVLLLGPYIDSAHPCIKSGDIDYSPNELFRQKFIEPLRDFLNMSSGSLVLLVPSVHDVLSDHPVFPQCELGSEYSVHPRIRMLPNPCRFTINDIKFATTSVDSLFHLRNQEIMKRGEEVDPVPSSDSPGNDIMANTCRHIFQQRSIYPLYPVPAELSHDVNLDVTHSEGTRLDNRGNDYAPDVIVLPSKLKHFSKVVDSTMAINPSYLTKGTYAVLRVGPATSSIIKERMSCDVIKL